MRYLAGLLLLCSLDAEAVRIRVLATTDLHGNIFPTDYFTERPAARGLAKIATLIRAARAENPNGVLVDVGDTIQGSPIESVHQFYMLHGRYPLNLNPDVALRTDPMMKAMNALGYDMMVPGNHEFNYGLKNLEAARSDAKFPWVSANVLGGEKPFQPYIVKTIAGVRVGIFGITTPTIAKWEQPPHYRGLKFLSGVEGARIAVEKLKAEKADIIVAAVHAGLGRDLKTGKRDADYDGENMAYDIAESVAGIDALVFGHTHNSVDGADIGGVTVLQPKNWGGSLGVFDFDMERADGKWKLVKKTGHLRPVTAATAVDAEVAKLAKPYEDITLRYLNTPVTKIPVPLAGATGRVEDTALVDAAHAVQLHFGKADVSLTAMYNPRLRIPAGPVTVREIAAMQLYDNQLYVVEGTGKMVREALENSAKFFLTCRDAACASGPLIDRSIPGYNYDTAEGVEYEIDLREPVGKRVKNLTYKGKPLAEEQPLRIALSNYRFGGSGGYGMFRAGKIIYQSPTDIRDMIIEYYSAGNPFPTNQSGNWRIVPEGARKTLGVEADREASANRDR